MNPAILLPLLALTATWLPAQPASYSYLSQPTPYTDPAQPWLTALNLPRVSTTFQILVPIGWATMASCPPSNPGMGFIGTGYTLATGMSNPQRDLAAIGIRGVLFSSAEDIVPLPGAGFPGARVTVTYAIPNATALIGLPFFQQVMACSFATCIASGPTCTLGRGGAGVVGM